MYQFRIGKPGALGLAAFFFFAAAGCESHDSHGHWSYKEATGPENWGDLSAEFQACKLVRGIPEKKTRRGSFLTAACEIK